MRAILAALNPAVTGLAVAVLLAVAPAVHGQSLTGPAGAVATGSTTYRSLADRAADVVNVKDFGAKGDGATDDAAAINAAVQVIRSAEQPGGNNKILVFPQGKYVIDAPINLTCLGSATTSQGCATSGTDGTFPIEGAGAVIECKTSGAPCLDALGSRMLAIYDLRIIGACDATEPSYGIQIGRTANGVGADRNSLTDVSSFGCFSKSAFYSLASEDTNLISTHFSNGDTGGSAYSGIFDAGNHWGVTSSFVTESITTDQRQSFNDNVVLGGDFTQSTTSAGGALWIYGTRRLRLSNVYLSSADGSCLVLYDDGTGGDDSIAEMLTADVHCEPEGTGNTITSAVLVTGGTAGAHVSPVITSLTYRDHYDFSTAEVFKRDAYVNTVQLRNAAIDIPNAKNTPSLFDNGADWLLSSPEKVKLAPTISGWTPVVGGVACTGLGTGGTCTLRNGAHYDSNNPTKGQISLTAGSSGGASSGTVDLAFPASFLYSADCSATLASGSGAWHSGATVTERGGTNTGIKFNWSNNGTALTASTYVVINYRCTSS